MTLLDTLRAAAPRWELGKPALIGVSGGVDSVVLFDVLRRLGAESLVVVHVHHGLRGAAADEDEAFVRHLADSEGCCCEVMRVNVAAQAQVNGRSIETEGRAVRQSFFQEMAVQHQIERVFLAHHADDQVETLLMNLARGAGVNGLAAMRERARWGALEVVRPLLNLWRKDVLAHAGVYGLKWREDETNAERNAFRNRIRLEMVPALQAALGRDVKTALWRTAILAAEDESWMCAHAQEALSEALWSDGTLKISVLRQLPRAMLRRVVRMWLEQQGVEQITFSVIDGALEVIAAWAKPASLNLSANRRLRRREGRLFVDSQNDAASEECKRVTNDRE